MVRDVTEDKIDYALALDGPMFKRDAIHLTNGAKKYAKRNWMKARSQEELDRFRESALRHMFQWFAGETDEDHAAAVRFNINGAEYVREQLADDVEPTENSHCAHVFDGIFKPGCTNCRDDLDEMSSLSG